MKPSERIAELLKQRAAKSSVLEDLLAKVEKEDRTFNADEQTAFDTTKKEIEDIDGHVTRLKETEAILAKGALAVNQPRIVTVNNVAKGIRFARMCQAVAASRGNFMQAQEIARNNWPDDHDITSILRAQAMGVTRAAVAAGTTTDPAWAGALVAAQTLSGELIELVMKEAVIGQLGQVRRVPFNVRIPREVAALGTVQWVGQGASKPVGKGSYDFVTIPWAKVALIVVITEELARFSNPAAETLMRDSLVRAIKDFLDDQFVGSGVAPVAGVSPGGITNALPVGQIIISSGGTVSNIQADLIGAVSKLNANNAPRAPTWIMHPQTLINIAGQINAFGQPAFPTAANKTLMGYPVITSAHVSPAEVILLDQAGVLLASDDSVTVDVSREASVQMDGAPATPPTPLVSFWQQNLIGLKAEQFAYWMRARDADVVLINAVDYAPVIVVANAPTATRSKAA